MSKDTKLMQIGLSAIRGFGMKSLIKVISSKEAFKGETAAARLKPKDKDTGPRRHLQS